MVGTMFAAALAMFFGLRSLAYTLVVLKTGENLGTTLLAILVTAVAIIHVRYWREAAIESIIVTETGIGYHGPGQDIFAKWADVVRVEWKQGVQGKEIYLISQQTQIDRKFFWRFVPDIEDIPLARVMPFKAHFRQDFPMPYPLLEDILRHAPHVKIVEIGKRKKKRWGLG